MRIDLLEAFGLELKIINVLKRKYGDNLLPLQEKAFKAHQIMRGGNFLVSAVTSSGKTLIGEILALHYGSMGKRAFYLVPTKALAEEKFEQFSEDYRQAGINTVISTHDRQEYDNQILSGHYHIAIIVYEKLLALLVLKPELINDVGLIVIDELQYMTDEDRGPTLEMLLTRILLQPEQPQLVGLSAVLGKSENLAEWLKATLIREKVRPVELRQGVFFEGKFKYREFNSGQTGEEIWFDLRSDMNDAMGQLQETAKYLVEGKGEQTVFFLPDKPKTESLAWRLARTLTLSPANGAIAEMQSLDESVSRDMLLQLLQSGAAVHTADLSWDERDIIERYVRSGEIRVLCCTSTLAVGLNLPMKNAIIIPKRWKTFRDTGNVMLVNIAVSDFENMGGRVARYGYISDFGRAIFVTASHVDHIFYYNHYACGDLEDLEPALDRGGMDRHILNLIASAICRTEDEIRRFLKNTFTAHTLWNREMTDADYDRIIRETLDLCIKWNLIRTEGAKRLVATREGKITAAKGITLKTAAFFLDFLRNADPHQVSELELLLLLGLCRDSLLIYIPLKSQTGFGGYGQELKQVVYENAEEDKQLFQSLWHPSSLVMPDDQERAIKKTLMMQQWLGKTETKAIERHFQVFSGAIKKVGEDFSWLAETLAAFAKVAGWDERFISRIDNLSQRLVYGVPEKGLALSKIRIRGFGRAHINRLVHEGYDTAEIIADLPLSELERLLPKRLAERLYNHFRKEYETPKVTTPDDRAKVKEEPGRSHVPAEAHEESENSSVFPCLLFDIIENESLLATFRMRLYDVKNLKDLILNPPLIFIDEGRQLLWYRGIPIQLWPASFYYLLLLAKRPKEMLKREEIYNHLWPGDMNYSGTNKPYERQISDHKRKLIAQIRKGMTGKGEFGPQELETLIFTRPKLGYMLNVNKENVFILP